MRRLIAVLGCMLACSSPTTPNTTKNGIRVSPHDATVEIGQSQQLSAASLDANGDSTGRAAVTWTSSAAGVASVTNDGLATGLTPGVTTVVAATSDGKRDSSRITVIAGACGGIAHAQHLHGTANFTYTYAATLGDVQYAVNDAASMTFTADAQGPGDGQHVIWIGSATGSGSEQETRTDHASDQVETLTGNGDLIVQDINLSHVIITVDLTNCSYTLEGNPYIDVVENPDPGDLGPSWIGWFRTLSTPLDAGSQSGSLAVHSVAWLEPNYAAASGWYVPLGFSSDYFSEGASDNGSTGHLDITYEVTRGT